MEPTTAVDVLLRYADPGQAIVGLAEIDEGEVATILIREDALRAGRLPEEPAIYMRSGGLVEDVFGTKVVVCVLLAHVEGVASTYEVWLNAHNPAHRHCLERLGKQQKLLFRFYVDGPEPVRTVYLPNSFARFAEQIVTAADSVPVWSMDQFDVAKGLIEARHTEPHLLWDVLTPAGEPTYAEMVSHVGQPA